MEKDCLFIRWAGREREVNVGKRKTILLQEIRRGRIRKISFRIAATVALLMALGGMYLFVSVSYTHLQCSPLVVRSLVLFYAAIGVCR